MKGFGNNARHYGDNIANLQRLIERAQGGGSDSFQLIFKAGQLIGSTRRQVNEEWLITTSQLVRARMLQDLDNALYLCADALAKSLYVDGIYNKSAQDKRTAEYLAEALRKCDLATDINAGVNV